MVATQYPLTRRAIAAWPRWRECDGLTRRNWERHCELTGPEISALEHLGANLWELGPAAGWFDANHAHVRPDVVPELLGGLQLREQDLVQFVRGLGLGNGFHQQWLDAAIRKALAEEWKQAQAAQQREDRNRAEQRAARDRAQAEAEAAAELERRRQAQWEWEQKQSEREAAKAKEKPMETATLNGNGVRLEMPDGLTELQRDVWDALRERHMNPRVDISTMTKRDVARQVDSTEGSVGAALSVIRRRLREEADGHLRGLPDAAPAEERVIGEGPAASTDPIVASVESTDEPAAASTDPDAVAPTFPDPRHWDGEQRLKELSDQNAALLQMIASLDGQAKLLEARITELTAMATAATQERNKTREQLADLERELEQVTADRAKAWEELHDIKNGSQVVSIEPATITAEMERQAAAMFPDLVRVQLTMDNKRLALDLAAGCDVSDHLTELPLDTRAEILRKAADAVEAVLA